MVRGGGFSSVKGAFCPFRRLPSVVSLMAQILVHLALSSYTELALRLRFVHWGAGNKPWNERSSRH